MTEGKQVLTGQHVQVPKVIQDHGLPFLYVPTRINASLTRPRTGAVTGAISAAGQGPVVPRVIKLLIDKSQSGVPV